ncbi:hypothetical protein IJ103_00105 [Candidatus Saccharibacteria bacterium]|nr:hypothetical protein [Candidatus Saccharibacteria bacterium]
MANADLAYKMCLGLFAQSSSGASLTSLKDASDAALKFGASSILPKEFKFTNFQIGDTTIETTSSAYITDLDKVAKFTSGLVTPGDVSLNVERPANIAGIMSTLRDVVADDPYKVLFLAGWFKEEANGVRTYDVFYASTGIVSTADGISGEAGQKFTSTLGIKLSGAPTETAANVGATLTWTTSTGAVTWSA